MSTTSSSDPLSLCSARWITTYPNLLDSNKSDVEIQFWRDGRLDLECSHTYDNSKIEGIAKKIAFRLAVKENIPLIPADRQIILFDYFEDKYRAFLAPPVGCAIPITKKYSRFLKCAQKAAILSEALEAPILVSDKTGQVRIFRFPTIIHSKPV